VGRTYFDEHSADSEIMIQTDILNSIAVGVVGWEQPTVAGSPTITVANLASSSGLYYQHGSGLCTVQNIKDTIEDSSVSDTDLNTILGNFSKSALSRICGQVFNENDHIDTGLLFKYENKWNELLTNNTSFVGYEIDLSKRNDLTLVINSLILEFDSITTKKILLFNSQMNAAVKTQSVTTVANSAKYQSVDWRLNDLQYGGKWYIGYLRSSSDTPRAVKRNFEMANYSSSTVSRRYTSGTFIKGTTVSTSTLTTIVGFTAPVITWTPNNTAIDEVKANQYSVYPNPTRSTVYVSGFDIKGIDVLTLNGKYIFSTNNQRMDLSALPKGVYLAKLTTNAGVFFKKIEKL